MSATDELWSSEEAKSVNECYDEEVEDGVAVLDKDSEISSAQTDSVPTADDALAEPDKTLKVHHCEKKLIDFRGKLYLAPLTTIGYNVMKFQGIETHWDITSGERLNVLMDYVRFGLEHWGSDTKGVEKTRHFLLEWLSYACRYIPVGLLDVIPQRLNRRPPSYYGRDDLETLMASSAADWIRISEMLLGKVPDGFTFAPKHKSDAYDRADNG
ncbi:hypothetical protein SLA2020_494600 [Shorea laevis]